MEQGYQNLKLFLDNVYFVREDMQSDSKELIENKVTIRVWLPTDRLSKSFGHTALKTNRGGSEGKGIYASFWPGICGTLNESKAEDFCKKTCSHLHTPDMDDIIEQFEQLSEYHFYNLDVDAINKKFLQFQNNNFQWDILGSLFLKLKNANNCCGVVSELLIEGKIYNLLSLPRDIFTTMILASIIGIPLHFLFKSLIYENKFLFSHVLPNLVNIPSLAVAISSTLHDAVLARIISRKFHLTALHSVNFSLSFRRLMSFALLCFLVPRDKRKLIFLYAGLIPANFGFFLLIIKKLVRFDSPDTLSLAYTMGFLIRPISLIVGFLFFQSNYEDLKYDIASTGFQLALYGTSLLAASLSPRLFSLSGIVCTPKEIKDLSEDAKRIEEEKNNSRQQIRPKSKNRLKKMIFIGVVSAATVGLFYYCKSKNQNHVNQSLSLKNN